MKIKLVKDLKSGDVLADSIYTGSKQLLVPVGTTLKEEYIELLMTLDIPTVLVEEKFDGLINKQHILSKETEEQVYIQIKEVLEKYIYKEQKTLDKIKMIAEQVVDLIEKIDVSRTYDFDTSPSNLYAHTLKVTLLCVALGKKMNMDRQHLYDIAVGALLHDLGLRFISVSYDNFDMETGIPTEVFELKKHTILGYTVLEEQLWMSDISKKMVLSHHEKVDGSGYPLKQRNQEIECKIIQVCDSFEGMISGMEQVRHSVSETIDILNKNDGLYDTKVLEAFLGLVAKYPTGTILKLDHNEKAVVLEQTKTADRPIAAYIINDKISDRIIDLHINTEVEIEVID